MYIDPAWCHVPSNTTRFTEEKDECGIELSSTAVKRSGYSNYELSVLVRGMDVAVLAVRSWKE